MRIAYVISTLKRCGPVNVLYDIVKYLPSNTNVKVFTLAQEDENSRKADFENLGCETECVVTNRASSMIIGSRMLDRALRVFSPNAVHAHGYRAYRLCQHLGYPLVATVHNCIYDDYAMTYNRTIARWLTHSEISALNHFDKIVACSESNAHLLQEEYNLPVSIIRNGVDQQRFVPLSIDEKKEIRKSLGFSSEAQVFISTGGCSELKGTLDLIDAFHVAHMHTGAISELHVLGDGATYETCKARGYDDVRMHGFIDDVIPYLQAADCFVSASTSEGMPLAVLEGLSCGLTALLSDIAPHREIAEAQGDASSVGVFRVNDVDALERCFEGAMDSKYQHSQASDVSIFSAERMATRYYEAYEELVTQGKELV